MTDVPPRRPPARPLQQMVIDADDVLDAARLRFNQRFGRNQPRQIAAYRAFADDRGVDLHGRVLANPPLDLPTAGHRWWNNLLDTYRRFESDEVPGVRLSAGFRNARADTVTDHEGYYHVRIEAPPVDHGLLWDNATIAMADGSLVTPQPVLQVGRDAEFGVISDIDDTILHSSITNWKAAAQLAFLHNARTRKPLLGVARLYQALQAGTAGHGHNPLFYVSSSPWNLYDLLEDFLDLNAIPPGPIFLRDLGTDQGKFIKSAGHGHKLERAREIIQRLPRLRWVLMGDSGQADAELYAQAAQEFGERIAAIYIRDVDGHDSPRDRAVDAHIERVAGTRVPMLRVADSLAIAEHACTLGLLHESALAAVATDVGRDRSRPSLVEAAGSAVADATKGALGDVAGPRGG